MAKKIVLKFATLFFLLLHLQLLAQDIPFSNNLMFHCDGRLIKQSGNWYFQDITGKGRHLLITGIDFDTTPGALKGFPYHSTATISAPAGDGEMISVDFNNFFYTAGVPNQIPVSALFENVDFANRLFCLHQAQVISNGNEARSGRVANIIFYKDAKTGSDYLALKTIFKLSTELSDADAIFVSEAGSDATGNGTKANPYRTPHPARNTTKSVIYMLSGTYSSGATTSTFTGSALTIQGIGNVRWTLANGASGIINQRPLTIRNVELRDTASSRAIDMQQNLTLYNCRLTKIRGSYFILANNAGRDVSILFCNIPVSFFGAGLVRNNIAPGTVTINGCGGKIANTFQNTAFPARVVLTYNRGLAGSTSLIYTNGATYNKNINLGALTFAGLTSRVVFDREVFNATLTVNDSVYINRCTINGNLVGKIDSIENSIVNGYLQLTAKPFLIVDAVTVTSPATANDAISITAAANSFIPGVIVRNCFITANMTSTSAVLYIGEPGQAGVGTAIVGFVIFNNRITNTSNIASGQCHTLYMNGLNSRAIFNYITVANGYGIVIKHAGATFTSAAATIYGNVFFVTGLPSYIVLGKGTENLIVANNTIPSAKCGSVMFETNDNALGHVNSMLLVNNYAKLTANAPTLGWRNGANMTSRRNKIFLNGFTCTIPSTDSTTTIDVDVNGAPTARLDYAEAVPGTDGDRGLAVGYNIPSAILFRFQNSPLQIGAVIQQ